jgi:hypothetical protein
MRPFDGLTAQHGQFCAVRLSSDLFCVLQVDVHTDPYTSTPTTRPNLLQRTPALGSVWGSQWVLPYSSRHMH